MNYLYFEIHDYKLELKYSPVSSVSDMVFARGGMSQTVVAYNIDIGVFQSLAII